MPAIIQIIVINWFLCTLFSRITAKIDDDMIRYYVDEDLFLLEVSHSRLSQEQHQERSSRTDNGSPQDPGDGLESYYDVTLIELPLIPQPTSLASASPHQSSVVQLHVAAT